MTALLLSVHAALIGVAVRRLLITGRRTAWGLITAGIVVAAVWTAMADLALPSSLMISAVLVLVIAGAAMLAPTRASARSSAGGTSPEGEVHRNAAHESVDILSMVDRDGTVRYVSGAVERILGYHPEELMGQSAFRYVHKRDYREVLRVFAPPTSTSGPQQSVRHRFRHADGSWRAMETCGRNLLDDEHVGAIVLSSRAVTELVQHNKMPHLWIRQQEVVAELSAFALATESVQSLFDKTTTMVRETLGSAYCVVFDREEDRNCLAVRASDGVPEHQIPQLVARAEPAISIDAAFIPDVSAHPAFSQVDAVHELGIVSGALVQVSTESGVPIYLASFSTSFRDYTQHDLIFLKSVANVIAVAAGHHWVEHALQTAERSVHTLLSNMPLVFWAWDADGVFTHSQGAGLEQLGLRPGQVVGQSVWDVYKEVPQILAHSKRALAGESFEATVDLGETFWDVWYRPVRDEAGEVTGVLGIALDVADRRRAEERERRIFEMSRELLCVGTVEGRLVSVNPAFVQTLGWAEEELLAASLLTFVHPDDRELTLGELKRIAEGLHTVRFENRCRSKNGEYRWLSWMAVPRLETGLVYASARDVTDEKKAQRALEISEEKFAKAFHSNPTLMAITRISDSRFVEVNERYLQSLGYSREEVIGHSALDLGIWADHREREAVVSELLAKGSIRDREVEYIAKNGDTTIGLLSAEVIVVGGEAYGLALIHDITLRKRTEEALIRSEAEYRHLVDHAVYGIYRSNEDGTLLSVNPALVDMLGYDDADELMGVHMARDLYVNEGERERLIDRYRERARIENLDIEWLRKDGSPVTVRLSGRPMHDHDSGELQFEIFAEDVTERRGLEAQLRQAQKMEAIGQLTGGIAHDFNNILTAVLGNAEILAADLPAEFANLQAEVSDIRSAAQRGAAMIRKLMTFSRREKLEMDVIDPDQLCRDTTGMLRRILSENIEIDVRPGDVKRTVRADRGAIEQILVNLATNARDAMHNGGILTVETGLADIGAREAALHGAEHVGEYVVITVRDTGTGMDPETLSHVFEPFYTTKPTGRGTGLGMAMVYGMVTRHGGFVEIESNPGLGTTVRIAFPATTLDAPVEPSGPAEELPRGRERVLLVEDEAMLRTMGERVLSKFGYDVITADDGQQAWEMVSERADPVDIIVTDVIMPRMSGGELYRLVRGAGIPTPFLFTTGYAASEIDENALSADGVPLLQKPWTAEDLVRSVRTALDKTLV